MAIATDYFPESYFPGLAYLPAFFKPQQVSYSLSEVSLELDATGKTSIIHLIDPNGDKICPFFDFSKYDGEMKDWYWYDTVDVLPYRNSRGNLAPIYPASLGTLSQPSFGPKQYSQTSGVWSNVSAQGIPGTTVFTKYFPIIIIGNNVLYTDLTDYSNLTQTNSIDQFTTSPQFYYDFQERIYTNMDLASYNPTSFSMILYSIGSKGTNPVAAKCSMSSAGQNKSTPVIKDYVLKLKGQYLGS